MVADFHSHILPAVDDGSSSVEQSLEMLRSMREQQIRRVVATPHFYPTRDHPDAFLKRRQDALELLQGAMEAGMPQIIPGAEVHYFDGISDCEDLNKLTIGNSPYLLLEMPYPPWSEKMYRQILEIRQKRGLIPVMAHVDRYIHPLRTYGIPQRLMELPVLVQANSSFFLDWMTRSMALKMLRAGQIHLLGSDCHNTTTRVPDLGKAVAVIRKALGEEILLELEETEQEILN